MTCSIDTTEHPVAEVLARWRTEAAAVRSRWDAHGVAQPSQAAALRSNGFCDALSAGWLP